MDGIPAAAATAWLPINRCPPGIICPAHPGRMPGGGPPIAAVTVALPAAACALPAAADPGSAVVPECGALARPRGSRAAGIAGDTTGVAGRGA
ncbi:hypothetical protein [Amycolatopsis sp. WGS_07]|uniref:hypothetical protein n=1 Tax=Amycolatopsis sp. WGS_07 TaxID=3076764 RepID=UPI003872B278